MDFTLDTELATDFDSPTFASTSTDDAVTQTSRDVPAVELPPAKKLRRRVTRPAGGPAFSLADIQLPTRETPAEPAPANSAPDRPDAPEPKTAHVEPQKTEPAAIPDNPETSDSIAPENDSAPVAPIRHAATALLFQAPDLTPRKPRRAQAPAGPPREHKQVPPQIDDAETAPVSSPREKSARHQASKKSEVRAGTEVDVSASSVPTAEARQMTRSESQAAAEVGAIEAEIFASGGEPAHFSALDLVEDSDDVELEQDNRRRRRRGGRGRRINGKYENESGDFDDDGDEVSEAESDEGPKSRVSVRTPDDEAASSESAEAQVRRRRQRGTKADRADTRGERGDSRTASRDIRDEVTALKGSTRLEAKRQRRRESRQTGRRRQIVTESEFLARRESVDRKMVIRETNGRIQIAVLEDGVLVEHYVSEQAQASMVGNIYLGRVQNVLPSMEAAFVDVGKGRNAVLYAGEVNWDAAGIESANSKRIEQALKSNDTVLVQVTKDPIGQKGARLTSQITLAGRYLVLVPEGGMTGISRKLPEVERDRLKRILRQIVPDGAGVIVRTAAAGASEEELRTDVERLLSQWETISEKAAKPNANAPALLQGEPDLAIRVVRDIFNDDFGQLIVAGSSTYHELQDYVGDLAPELRERVTLWNETGDVFAAYRVDEQLAKGMDRKVWLPSGGSLVIDRTEAMTVVDVNTGKFTGVGGTLEETVTRNNLEAAEEIVRQLRLRDIGGIIVIDFIDMVLESNRDLVLRRLVECLGRDRTKHQVAEVTSLGLVQMTRKRVGQGLVEAFSVTCETCNGRGFMVTGQPIDAMPIGSEKGYRNGRAENGRHHRSDNNRELDNAGPKALMPNETSPNGFDVSSESHGDRGHSDRGHSDRGHSDKGHVDKGHNDNGGHKHSSHLPIPGDNRRRVNSHHLDVPVLPEEHTQAREAVKATLAAIAAAAAHAHEHDHDHEHGAGNGPELEPSTEVDHGAELIPVAEFDADGVSEVAGVSETDGISETTVVTATDEVIISE